MKNESLTDEHLEEEATKLGAREQVIEDLGLPPIYSQLEPTQRVSNNQKRDGDEL